MSSTYGRRSPDRPLGITILCVVAGLGALKSIVASLGMLGTPSPFAVFGLVGLALAVGKLVILYGLWNMAAWGYRWALAIYAVGALLSLVQFDVLGLLIDVLVVVYLTSKADRFR